MRHYIFIIALIMSALLITGCQQSDDESTPEPTEVPAEVSEDTPEDSESNDIAETAEATEVVETEEAVVETEEPASTPESTPLTNESVSDGGEYYIAVSYTTEPPADLPAPPDGQQWIIVVATLANQGGATVTVSAEDLTLLDIQGNTYTPEAPDDSTEPPLVGAELTEGDDVLGLVRFAIPTEAALDVLEWCPGGTCEAPIRSDIP